MGRMKMSLVAVTLIVAPFAVALTYPTTEAGAGTTAPVNASSWTNTPVAAGAGDSQLDSISCTTGTTCVAVGSQNDGAGGGALTESWNGTSWTVVGNPDQFLTGNAVLNSVSCVGTSFCMAVGSTSNNSNPGLAVTWNGSAWSEATSGITVPAGASVAELFAVSCVSSTMCEALGSYYIANVPSLMAFQWNGSSWNQETVPTPSGTGAPPLTRPKGIDCVSTTWCMAVGGTDVGSGGSTPFSLLWNGSSWALLTTPAPTTGTGSFLASVSCAGASYCKAVGTDVSATSESNLAETWNGSSWSIDPSVPNDAPNSLSGVDCSSATSCTAVGTSGSSDSLVLSWNGAAWNIVPNTPNGATPTTIYGISCLTDWACMAVGGASSHPYAMSAPIARAGYRLVASDGGIFAYGGSTAPFYGSTGGLTLNKPVVGMGVMPAGDGYYLVASDGGVFNYGSAKFYGSTGSITLNKPIVGMAVTPDGAGYWLVASDGGIFSFGDAAFYGSTGGMNLNKPIVGMASTPDGKGYWLVASDGGIFSFGDAAFYGSTGGMTLNKPIVGMAAPSAGGYYLVASDGGIFSYGGAPFYGSTGGITLNKPIVGMTTVSGGYYLSGSDGGVFAFPGTNGVPPFLGSTGGMTLNKPIVGITS